MIDEVIEMLNSEDCKLSTDGMCLMRYKVRDCCKCILEEYTKTVYNKAIDDFVAKIMSNGAIADLMKDYLQDIAGQLKVGVENVD